MLVDLIDKIVIKMDWYKSSRGVILAFVDENYLINLEMLRWFISSSSVKDINIAYKIASENGQVYVLKWLYEHGYKVYDYVYYQAMLYGQREVLKWCHDIKIVEEYMDPCFIQLAIETGQFELLQWCYDNKYIDRDYRFCLCFLANNVVNDDNRHKGLKWLHDNGFRDRCDCEH